jgi:hypothetical protein
MRSVAAAAVLLLCASGVGAQVVEPEQPIQELFTGETVFVQGRGEVQFTTVLDGRKDGDAKSWTAAQEIQYGVTDWLELDAALPFVNGLESTALSHAGLGDIELGFLLGLARHIRTGAFSVGARVRLPTGDEAKGHGDGETAPETVVIFGKALGKAQLHASAEVGFPNKAAPREWTYGAGVVVPTGRWRETLELDARHEGDEDRLLLTPGLYFKPRKAFEIGVGVPIGLTQRSSDVGAVVVATLGLGGR